MPVWAKIVLVIVLYLGFAVALVEIGLAARRRRWNSIDSVWVSYARPEANPDPVLRELDGIGGRR
jgi:hypothetical protein